MLQQDYLFPWRLIYENAVIGLELQGKRTPENEQYVDHLLEEMGPFSNNHDSPAQLSGGMRQRVALVRTLATKPDYMLLDEPFSALDYQTKLQLEDLVAETLKAHKKTALLVTHDISEAIAMSDRVIVLEASPGLIRRQVTIPPEIRSLLPFSARDQAGFQRLFQEIWQEFEDMRVRGGCPDGG
ncbi:ABC transporter, ATP-binding protein [Paenibacillus larvae subsp. larvae]|uniref:ABC transporter, ATP-binding protein n=1 Tax=Paenibacillus larvae subsp. larvae TaxID=147375 RepID=A0A2L1TZ85_9BACL|nr:ABC transporter, ATP-binding protein [Paenibacillus larvae subsp. larvae]AVF30768.1 ABC transporter, ATP-binding protein [Paenibacillus larvae subsp. larvae]